MLLQHKQKHKMMDWIRLLVLAGLVLLLGIAFEPLLRLLGPQPLAARRVMAAQEDTDINSPLFVTAPLLAPTDGITQDIVYAIAITPNGEMVVAGETGSADFPVVNAWQGSNAGNTDAFVSKISADGQTLLFSTYLGGISDDVAYSVDLDAAGNIYVGGKTRSINFPVVNALQSTRPGTEAAFVAMFSPDGQALQFSTYLGGDQAYPPYGAKSHLEGLVVDATGGIYTIGTTTTPDFPLVNPLPYQADGSSKVFVTHLAPGGQQVLFSTLLGVAGSRNYGVDIAQDDSGRAHFLARSWEGGLPVVNPLQGSHEGAYDVYLARLAADNSTLEYATYLGGEGWDVGTALAVDAGSNVHITGWTQSDDFPVKNAYQDQKLGNTDAFLSKVNAAGTDLIYSTYLGGSVDNNGYMADTYASALDVDASGRATIAGKTGSIDFPLANPWQNTLNGPYLDGFITMFNPAGDALVFSTYLGGEETNFFFADTVRALDVGGPNDDLFVGGSTTAADFPLAQPLYTYQGFLDGFVSHFDPIASDLVYSTYLGGSAYPVPTDVNLSDVAGQMGINRPVLWGGLLLLLSGLGYFVWQRLKTA